MPLSHLQSVLHIEDEMLIAMDVEEVLLGAGVRQVHRVGTVSGALALLGSEKNIDVAIVDTVVVDGETTVVAEALQSAGIPYVMMSGYIDPTRSGFEGVIWLHKPVPDAALIDALQKITLHPANPVK